MGLPQQVAGGTAKIDGDKDEVTLEFLPESRVAVVKTTLLLTGKVKANGRDESISLPPIAAEVKEPYSLEILTTNPTVPAGGKTKIAGVLRRLSPFDEPVTIALEGSPPPHISVAPVTVAKGEALVQVEIVAGAEAKAGEIEILLRASSHDLRPQADQGLRHPRRAGEGDGHSSGHRTGCLELERMLQSATNDRGS